jgi:shikimate dehydrogenase
LGDPVDHSLSPVIHTAALQAGGIDGTYLARRVDATGVRTAIDEIRMGDLDGANVTMPHKALAASLCDRLDPDALRAGSVNTLVREGSEVVGYSTDIGGIRDAWDALPRGGPVLVLGAGGAAAAAYVALADRRLYGSARRPEAVDEVRGRVAVEVGRLAWGVGVVGAVLVNATPLGMEGEDLPEAVVGLVSGLFDMPYGRGPTPAVRSVRRAGLPVVDGLDLLIAQAARSFRLWTGIAPSVEVMRAALENLSRPPTIGPNP